MALVSAATSYGSGLLPDIYAGMASFLTAAGPRRTRSTVKWSWNILYAIAAVMVVLSWHSVTGMLVSMARRSHGGHADPIRGRHAEQGRVGPRSGRRPERHRTGHRLADSASGARRRPRFTGRHAGRRSGRRLAHLRSGYHGQPSFHRFRHRRADPYRRLSEAVVGLGAFHQCVHPTYRSVRDAVQHHFAMLLGLHNIKLPRPHPTASPIPTNPRFWCWMHTPSNCPPT